MKRIQIFPLILTGILTLFSAITASAEEAVVQLVSDSYVVISLTDSGFYVGAHYSFSSDRTLKTGDTVSGASNTLGSQTWHIQRSGADVEMEIDRAYMSAKDAINFFTNKTRSRSSWLG